MPSGVKSIGGVACVSERSSAPQPVPAAMPLSCHCSVVPITGAALAPSAKPSNDVAHSENGVDNVADRSRPAGIVCPPPGAQPTRAGNGPLPRLCHSVGPVPSGKNWIWSVLVPIPARHVTPFHVRIARVGLASKKTFAAPICGVQALHAGAHRGLPCTSAAADPTSWMGFAVPGDTYPLEPTYSCVVVPPG